MHRTVPFDANRCAAWRRLLLAFGLAVAFGCAQAQEGRWPDKPIRVMVPFAPGGPSDMVIRLVAEKMRLTLKQPLVIEFRPGAGGNLGAAQIAHAAPDGYSWLWGPDTLVTVNPYVYRSMGYKADELLPVSLGVGFGQTLVCNPGVGVKTVAELVAAARAGKLSYASGGLGVPGHFSMELLLNLAGIEMTHVPYKGPAPAMQGVLGGQVDCGVLAGPTVLPYVRAGKLVALAVTGGSRSRALPDVPTMAEAGIPGFHAEFALVLLAPRGVPDVVVEKFGLAFVDALKTPEVMQKLEAADLTVICSTPAEARRTLAADARQWGEVAQRIKLQLD